MPPVKPGTDNTSTEGADIPDAPDASSSDFADQVDNIADNADNTTDGSDGTGDGVDADADADADAPVSGGESSSHEDVVDDTAAEADPGSTPDKSPEELQQDLHDELADGAKGFASDADATAYGQDRWKDITDDLSPQQIAALKDYTRELPGDSGVTYKQINAALRAGEPLHDDVAAHIARIDAALATRPLSDDVVVTRGTGTSHWGFSPADAKGNSLVERSYLSTSLGGPADAFAGKDAILHLRVPRGTPAVWAEDVSVFGGSERELLLGRGLTWEATGSVKIDGQWHVYGEVKS